MSKQGKQKIIEAAQRLISNQGVEKTSMRDIAIEAGITTGAIYYYYKSKEELLYDVMDYATAITANIIQMRNGAQSNPDQVLDEIARQVTQRVTHNANRRLRYNLAYQAALGDETLRKKFGSDYAGQAERTAQLFNYVFKMDATPMDLYLGIIMVAALDGIDLQQFIGALPVDAASLAKAYNEFFAYAVPRFLAQQDEAHRFDHLKD
jgi:AcrR family transcriptional regulator